VFPANYWQLLTKQTYNSRDKYKKPKDKHKQTPKTKPNKNKLTLIQSPLAASGQDWVYSNKKPQVPEPTRVLIINNEPTSNAKETTQLNYLIFTEIISYTLTIG